MKKILFVIYVTFTLVANSIAQNTQGFKIHIDSLNSEVKSFIEKYNIPGAAIAILNEDSIWIGTYLLTKIKKYKCQIKQYLD